jgi:methionyl aminopeptidase
MAIPEQYVKSGKIIREVREWIRGNVRTGTGILEIAVKVEEEIVKRGGQPAFPTGIGVNDVTAHYAPQGDEEGRIEAVDLVKIDYGVHIEGYVADTSITMTENPQHQPLLDATERALRAATEAAKRDRRIGEISRAIEVAAAADGFKPINNLSGHTVQQYVVHAGKSIPNLYTPGLPMLKKGDVFAIEPFLTYPDAAGYVVDRADDEATIFSLIIRKRTGDRELDDLLERIWSVRKTLPFTPRWFTSDYKEGRLVKLLHELERRRLVRSYPTLVEASGKPVAQFEHTLTIGDNGVTILT